MLIKIADNHYINSEQVRELKSILQANAPLRSSAPFGWYIWFANGDVIPVSDTAAEYLKVIMEANESMITENELAAQPAPSLTSRVAVILRDQFVGGATQDQIGAVLNLSLEETANELSEALAALITETIIIAQVRDEGAPIYYHATHAPQIIANPDLSDADAEPASAPAEYSERSEAPKSDG